MCADFKDYYLGSKLPRSEWLRISTKYMNEELLIELQDYVVAGTVLFEVVGSMYESFEDGNDGTADEIVPNRRSNVDIRTAEMESQQAAALVALAVSSLGGVLR